ncbi:MAG: hypothetical protein WC661_07115 [Opitutaceae bacterium]|jgi:hypothetical protein
MSYNECPEEYEGYEFPSRVVSASIRTHFVLLRGSDCLRDAGAPAYVVDRMATLAAVARQNKRDAVRLMAAVYGCLPDEPDNRPFMVRGGAS